MLGFADKTKKGYVPCDKNLELSQNSKVCHCDILKCHKMLQNYVYLLRLDFARNAFHFATWKGRKYGGGVVK